MQGLTKRVVGALLIATAGVWLVRAGLRYARRYDFRGKNVVVTGGSRGLGLLLARRLVDAGARVAICARYPEEVERARLELSERGGSIIGLECDVSDQAAVERLIQAVREIWGSVDVLINNAGVIQVGPESEMTMDDYQEAMNVHYWGPLYAIQAVLPDMGQRGGRIVNISSIGGLISVPHMLPYCGSKFALVGLSEGFRAHLLRNGIYVTTVCPGLMRTGSTVHAMFKGQPEAEYTWFSVSASTPVISMSAERAADEILKACRDGRAHLVLTLPAQLASWIHGLAPGLTSDTLGLVNRLLPGRNSGGRHPLSGLQSRPGWLPSLLTRLSDKAALRNNELVTSPTAVEAGK